MVMVVTVSMDSINRLVIGKTVFEDSAKTKVTLVPC